MSRWLLYALVSVVMYGMFGFLAGLNDRDEAHWLVTSAPMTIGVVPVLIPTGIVKGPSREEIPVAELHSRYWFHRRSELKTNWGQHAKRCMQI